MVFIPKKGEIFYTWISENSKNSKQFWNMIKMLKGKKKTNYTNYMKDSEGKKYFSDKEKCSLMENTWRDVLQRKMKITLTNNILII